MLNVYLHNELHTGASGRIIVLKRTLKNVTKCIMLSWEIEEHFRNTLEERLRSIRSSWDHLLLVHIVLKDMNNICGTDQLLSLVNDERQLSELYEQRSIHTIIIFRNSITWCTFDIMKMMLMFFSPLWYIIVWGGPIMSVDFQIASWPTKPNNKVVWKRSKGIVSSPTKKTWMFKKFH